MGRTRARSLRSLVSFCTLTRSCDWNSTKSSPLTAGTLLNTVIPLASNFFLRFTSTCVRSMVTLPSFELTDPVLDPVRTAASCLWAARLTATHTS